MVEASVVEASFLLAAESTKGGFTAEEWFSWGVVAGSSMWVEPVGSLVPRRVVPCHSLRKLPLSPSTVVVVDVVVPVSLLVRTSVQGKRFNVAVVSPVFFVDVISMEVT